MSEELATLIGGNKAARRKLQGRKRSQRRRERARAHKTIVPVEVGEAEINTLVRFLWLLERDACNPIAIGTAISRLLASLKA
jgi:hypothetical protein